MKRGGRPPWFSFCPTLAAGFAGLLAGGWLHGAALTPSEQRGKNIYFSGSGGTGEAITARLANANDAVPAGVFTCAGCHGSDGRGGAEGTVRAPDITWDALARPREAVPGGSGRRRAYTSAQVKRAVTMGLDAGGNPLAPEMPRFNLTQDQAGDLVAWLQRIGVDRDPGVSSGTVRLGVLLSRSPESAPVNQALRAVLREFFGDLNLRVGIYNHDVVLEFGTVPEEPVGQAAAIRQFLAEHEIFALLSSFLNLSAPEVGAAVRENEIPCIGPFCLEPDTNPAASRGVFYLDSGLTGQARGLVTFAARNPQWRGVPAAVVSQGAGGYPVVARALSAECERAGLGKAVACSLREDLLDVAPTVERLEGCRAGLVFFAGSAEGERSFLAEADRRGWHPTFMSFGSVPGRQLSGLASGFASRVFLAYPVQAPESLAPGRATLRKLAEKCQVEEALHGPAMAALAGASLLVEGLTRCGHDFSRARLIDRLEKVGRLETGFSPPLTYGANRRVGVLGADVFAVDMSVRKLVRVSAGDGGEP